MRLWRRRRQPALEQLPPARRIWPTTAEAQQIRQGFLLSHPDVVELVLTFDDGGPAYAAQLDQDLTLQLLPELERCMTAIEPLIAEDIRTRPTMEK